MTDIREIHDLVVEKFEGFHKFGDKTNNRLRVIEEHLREVEKKSGRSSLNGLALGKSLSEDLTEEQKEHKKAFDVYLRKGQTDGLSELEQKSMNSGSDPDGGYLVLPEMDEEIDRIAENVSAMFRLADVKTIKSAKYEKMVKTSGMAMRRVADGSGGGESTPPKYSKVEIEVHTAEVEPWVHNETLDDAFVDLGMDLAEEAGVAFAEGGGAEFIEGTGVAGARGILSYPIVDNTAFEWGSVGYIVSGKAASFTSVAPADALINLQHSIKTQYRKDAVWLMNDSTLGVVRQLKDGSGSYYLWQPDTSAGFGGRLLGHRVEIDNNLPDIGAGSYSIAFGNFKKGYKIINRKGVSLIRDPYTTKGQTKFNFRKRFGGGITQFEAIKLMKFATS